MSVKFSYIPLIVILILEICPVDIYSQSSKGNVRFFAGYRSLTLGDNSFEHDTHPDDYFLPNSGISGSAGTTQIDGELDFFTAGAGYRWFVSKVTSVNFDFGLLLGSQRDIQQNKNDTRHPFNAAFIYSEVNWGLINAAQVQFHMNRFYIGASTELGMVFVESGWDRYNKDEMVENNLEWVPTIGPVIGFYFIEATVQFGNKVGFGVQAVFNL